MYRASFIIIIIIIIIIIQNYPYALAAVSSNGCSAFAEVRWIKLIQNWEYNKLLC